MMYEPRLTVNVPPHLRVFLLLDNGGFSLLKLLNFADSIVHKVQNYDK